MTYEAWRISYQNPEAAAQDAYGNWSNTLNELAAAHKELDRLRRIYVRTLPSTKESTMKREITYCDVCEKQVTLIDYDGDTFKTGYSITPAAIFLTSAKKEDGVMSSKAGQLYGTDYCSLECLNKRLTAWLNDANVNLHINPKSNAKVKSETIAAINTAVSDMVANGASLEDVVAYLILAV